MRISFESPNQPDAIALIAELDAYQSALYPAESHHALDLASVAAQRLLFVVARDDAGHMVGCGAVVLSADYGELNRMYVRPQHRGSGLARKMLQTLEAAAIESRMQRDETGNRTLPAGGAWPVCPLRL